MNEAIKESLKKYDDKYEDDYKHKDSETITIVMECTTNRQIDRQIEQIRNALKQCSCKTDFQNQNMDISPKYNSLNSGFTSSSFCETLTS